MLQKDFDEIVTLILRGEQGRKKRKRKRRKEVHGDICICSHMWAVIFLLFCLLKCSMWHAVSRERHM